MHSVSNNGSHTSQVHPDLSQGKSARYSGWWIASPAAESKQRQYVAFKQEDGAHIHPALCLVGSNTVLCEGYWPFRPSFRPEVILGGICLYTSAWTIQFVAAPGNSTPRPLSLGLPGDLARIHTLLAKGRPIAAVNVPTRPGLYHQRLTKWQAEVLGRYPSVQTIRYTLPVNDYHGYIRNVESALGEPLPGLHAALDDYVTAIKHLLRNTMAAHYHKFRFDIPGTSDLKAVDATSRENDLRLYLNAVGESNVMGMEDLPEVALAYEVAQRTGVLIPSAVAVLGLPDPYMQREDQSYACRPFSLTELQSSVQYMKEMLNYA